MAKKMLIDATHPEETRVVVVDGNKVEEFDFETVNKRQLQGNIYLAKVTRVEPSLQAAFVDYGGNRHGFLAFAEIHPDYYQIPVADRKALLEEERALARAEEEEENRPRRNGPRNDRGPRPAQPAKIEDAVIVGDAPASDVVAEDAASSAVEISAVETAASVEAMPVDPVSRIGGMDVIDLSDDAEVEAVADIAAAPAVAAAHDDRSTEDRAEARPYKALDHAADIDEEIESIAEEDVAEEIRAPRKPRARRYKIQEVVKVRQIMLVQVVKEERGNKGAALTTYLSLAGRYCVLMPNTARGGGISRKITQAADRKKLKEIAGEMEVPEGAGLIIRTAGAKRTKQEIQRDYEYLMRLWEEIRELTLKSIAPAPIYEEGNLIKRAIRDLHNREIDEILVEGEAGYRTAKDFMRMIMPTQSRVVQRYNGDTPLFARHQVESYLSGMFNPTVQLKSGGYIVIGVTEALVAIDVNSGRATKEGSIEDTALKTNLEAAEEVARQLRLRDLAGLIVIDFIDMEERRNNAAVEKRLKDKLKTDRARIQVGRISGFGLMEMSRQRLRPGMLESTTQPCAHCHGTGLIRSDDSLALTILRALEEEGTRKRSKEVLLKAPVAVINYLINHKREHIALIEARYGMAVRMEADAHLVSPDYSIEKFKTAIRVVPEPTAAISGSAAFMGAEIEEDEDDLIEAELDTEEDAEDEGEESEGGEAGSGNGNGSKKKRRRRPRRRGGKSKEFGENGSSDDEGEGVPDDAEGAADAAAPLAETAVTEVAIVAQVTEVAVEAAADAGPEAAAEAKPAKAKSGSSRSKSGAASKSAASKAKAAEAGTAEADATTGGAADGEEGTAEKPKSSRARSSSAKTAAGKAKAEGDKPEGAKIKAPAKSSSRAKAKPAAAAPAATGPATAEPVADVPEAPVDAVVTEAAPVAEQPVLQADPGLTPVAETVRPDPAEDAAPKERRKGWWSR
ncbi:Rne/Rng family ribonuclease [Gemmobacter serpentinus]|uniref:Rne/Rng family ribonuclease n=1 Tax=Gemmobacter serpentinus TaxID=2652247 RepID=UPI00124D083A|nr:ribonuclease E/G [Gemmobacter serpentinus]